MVNFLEVTRPNILARNRSKMNMSISYVNGMNLKGIVLKKMVQFTFKLCDQMSDMYMRNKEWSI